MIKKRREACSLHRSPSVLVSSVPVLLAVLAVGHQVVSGSAGGPRRGHTAGSGRPRRCTVGGGGPWARYRPLSVEGKRSIGTQPPVLPKGETPHAMATAHATPISSCP